MNASLDHRVACTITSHLTSGGVVVPFDGGTISFVADGDGVRHCLARLERADGRVTEFAIAITVGGLGR